MDQKKDNISLEELLKIKSAERPNEQFWERFDLELNERALKTCIKKETWGDLIGFNLVDKLLPVASTVAFVLLLGLVSFVQFFQPNAQQSLKLVEASSYEPIAETIDVSLLANKDAVSEDYAVEIITLSADSDKLDFEADIIPVAIGSTADYTDSTPDTTILNYTQAYTQLASYAF
jgi:hypothetical protein